MSILSYNQINELFNQVAIAHYQIKRFGSGELSEADINKFISENQEYPVLWMTPVSVTTNSNVLLYSLNLLVFDLVNKDKDNEREVLSDCLQIALDVVRILRYGNAEFNIVTEPNISPFAGRYSDWVAGWSLEIELEVDIQSNNCDIPYEGLDLTQVLQSFVAEGEPGFQCIDLEGCELIINLQQDVATALNNTITGGTYNSGTTNLTLTTISGNEIIITGITSGGSGVTPDLQQVTDVGNTTTNNIEFQNAAEAQFGTGGGILLKNNSRLREGTIDAGTGGNKGIAQICAVGYELKWEAGSQYVMNGNGDTIREVNHTFTITPTVNDDISKGFIVGSRWVLDNGDLWICFNNDLGAADWQLQSICDELSNCAVITGLTGDVQTIFSSITGTPNQVAYYNVNGNLTGDTKFLRYDETNNYLTRINNTNYLNINEHQETLYDYNVVRSKVYNDDSGNLGETNLSSDEYFNYIQTSGGTYSGLDIVEKGGSFRFQDNAGLYTGFYYTYTNPGWSIVNGGTQYNYNLPITSYVAGGVLTDPNGDGNLQWDLPQNVTTNSGGQLFYLNISQAKGTNRYLSTTGSTAAQQSTGATIAAGATGTIASFQSDQLGITLIPGGIWAFYLHSYKNTNNSSFDIFVEVYKRTSGGTQTLLFTTDPTPITTNSPNPSMGLSDAYFSGSPILVTDSIVATVRATNTSNQSHTATLFSEGSQHYSYAISTLPSLIGLTCDNISGCSVIQTIETNLNNKYYKSGGTISGQVKITGDLNVNPPAIYQKGVQVTVSNSGTSYGVYSYATNGTNAYGFYGVASPGEFDTITNGIGGYFAVDNSNGYGVATNKYSLQLIDGTQGVGKVLTSVTSDGKANWADTVKLTTVSANTINISTTPTLNSSPSQLLSRNSSSGVVEYTDAAQYLNNSSTNQIYGSGFDGVLNFDGTNTYTAFTTKVGNVYTLTRSIFASGITVASGVTLDSNGYGVYCKGTLTINGTGQISANGNAGSNAVGATLGAGGASRNATGNYALIANTGGAGGNGGNSSAAGVGVSANIIYVGGAGGSGGTGKPVGNVAAVPFPAGVVTVSALQLPFSNTFLGQTLTFGNVIAYCAWPGAGGGPGINAGGSIVCGGGGGGSAPRIVVIFANTIVLSGSTSKITSNGGNGGNGSSTAAGNGTGGGGGGGAGGGFVYIITNTLTYTPNGQIQAKQGVGGNAGTGNGTVGGVSVTGVASQSGSNGVDGYVVIINPVSGTNVTYTQSY